MVGLCMAGDQSIIRPRTGPADPIGGRISPLARFLGKNDAAGLCENCFAFIKSYMKTEIRLIALLGVAAFTSVGNLSAGSCCSAAESAPPTAANLPPPAKSTSAVTPIAEVRRGEAVTVQGEVVRLRDEDEFLLRDDTGRIEIYIGWRNELTVAVGDRITVEGRADDDAFPGTRPEIYARAIILADGQRLELR